MKDSDFPLKMKIAIFQLNTNQNLTEKPQDPEFLVSEEIKDKWENWKL